MKIALLICGYLRSYKSNLNFIKNEIIEKYNNVDVYLHITKDENKEDKYFNDIQENDIKYIIDFLNPISTIIEYNSNYSENIKINNTINHWSKLFKLNELKKTNEEIHQQKYDLVIRFRPDFYIQTKNLFDLYKDTNTVYLPKDSKIDKIKLKHPNDGYLCDALAFGSSIIMDKYFEIYNKISDLIKNYGYVSETILYNYLNNSYIPYVLLDIDYNFILSKCNTFAICGDSGSGKSTLTNLLKKIFIDSFSLEGDRYHKWERYDNNWKNYTHLNPNANYISKMKEDVFNLKIGNTIYQVDYDHSNGKFTEKQTITPSNNLIVCGLHSLYNINHSVYDLKIFMDTQDELTHKWKIIRDSKKRGSNPNNVIEQIKKRENDYKKYIIPQKHNADLIIRFFCEEAIDIFDTNKIDNIYLKLSIRNNFNINKILDELKIHNINYKYDLNENFVDITFYNYIDSDIFSNKLIYKTNNFYDYIIYFILHLT